MKKTIARKVLISGGSIAGPATAFWLQRYGFDVTLVERAPEVRMGGYPIDVRGSAIRVVEKMGLLPVLRDAHIHTRRISFMDDEGKAFAVVKPEDLLGSDEESDVELPRWGLSSLLYEATREKVDYRFNESIVAMKEEADGVQVTFQSGRAEKFDIVIGADGLHSNTRKLAFGPEEQFLYYMGYTFAGFSAPNFAGLEQESEQYFTDHRTAGLYHVRGYDKVLGFLVVHRPYPENEDMRDVEGQRRMMTKAFAGLGWRVPELLEALQVADDIFCDTVSQIRMPTWSSGRVVLVGDAGYGPSFMSGQGTSMALIGAYVLAGELASNADHRTAFSRYESLYRTFVEDNQGITKKDGWRYIPNSKEEVETRRKSFMEIMRQAGSNEKAVANRKIYNSMQLPEYAV
jgi:2-polyprenyl-6-methoxyphenol hydroxylase-like FAD-dependent oxidoreductase